MASAPRQRQQPVLLLLPSVVLVKPRKQQQLRLLEVSVKQLKLQQLQVLEVLEGKLLKLQQPQVLGVLVKLPRRLLLQHSVASASLKQQLQLQPSGASGQASEPPQLQPLSPPHWEVSEQQPPLLLQHSEPPIPECLADWGAPLPSASLSLSPSSLSSLEVVMLRCTSL